MARKPPLTRIKSGTLSRGLSLARVSMVAGARAASHAMGNLFSSEENRSDRFKSLLVAQIEDLSRELGQLKGSLMKVGQMLSMYGEQFLPPEANTFLKSLQNQSPPLDWNEVQKTIRRQLKPEQLQELDIDPTPIASASLGQVHRAYRKSDGVWLAMKVQYPGVDQAIDSDLKALQSILSVSKLIPRGPKYDELFKEVRFMLHLEVDYTRELENTREFKARLVDDPKFVIPTVIPEYSTRRILTTTLEEGYPVDSPEVLGLPQERRDAIAAAALDLYFRELFDFGAVQTDPHFGNYRVRLGKEGAPDQLILFDFGAVRKLPKSFLNPYGEIIRGAHFRNPDRLLKGAEGVGFIHPEDSDELRSLFVEFCFLINEPFYTADTPGVRGDLFDEAGAYDFGESDLSQRVAKKAAQFAIAFKFRTPPREVVFLDRKLGGIFVFISVLRAKLKAAEIAAPYL